MNRLKFFFHHAFVHLRRDGQRTLFVLFCIAAGVAAVVSLRTLGLMVTDALLRDLQAANRSDIAVSFPSRIDPGSSMDRSLFETRGNTDEITGLSHTGEARLLNWAGQHGFQATPLWSTNGPFDRITRMDNDTSLTGEAAKSIMVLCIDPAVYPFYGTVQVTAPAGTSLPGALASPYDLAVTEGLAADLGLEVGTRVRLAGIANPLTVAAVINPAAEFSLSDPLRLAFPYAYVPYETCTRALHTRPNQYFIQVTPGTDVDAVKQELLTRFPGFEPVTTSDLRQVTGAFSGSLLQLVTIMGLVSLLIAGIGIANTMIVVVTRRAPEIAVLKTIGVQGRQVSLMFVIEALLLGTLGSLLGIPAGLGLVVVLQSGAERFVAQSIRFAVYPQALGLGLLLGIAVTVVFGLLPTLSAARVRPNLVLRPAADAALPPAGRLASLLTLAALTAFIGVLAGQVIGSLTTGVLAAYGLVILLGFFLLLLRLFVRLISRLPAFGFIPLKLSQREMDARRGRVASTLLTLVTGIFSLSLIWLLVQGSLDLITGTVDNFLNGNVLLAVNSLEDGRALERTVARLPGVTYTHDTIYTAEIIEINGSRDLDPLMDAAVLAAGGAGDPRTAVENFIKSFDMKVLDEHTWDYRIAAGQDITGENAMPAPSSHTTPILLEPRMMEPAAGWFNLQPGDTLTLRFPGGSTRTVVIAGITAQQNAGFLMQGLVELRAADSIVPARLIPRSESPQPTVYALSVPDELVNITMDALSELPGIFAFPTKELVAYTESIASQFVPLPLVVSALALFASSVIIANTVSLSTLERRRQIGIMKALGMQSESVLGLLLLENGLVGLLGGLLGTGLSALVLIPTGAFGDNTVPLGALALLILLAVALTLAATLLTAWGAAREKPLNVLRYE